MADKSTSGIAVACACGARLKAPAKAAGRQTRCPKCNATLTIPLPVGAVPKERAARGDKIKVRCTCGVKLSAPAAHAGKRIRCPQCREVMMVPGKTAVAAAPDISSAEADDLLPGLANGPALDVPQAAAAKSDSVYGLAAAKAGAADPYADGDALPEPKGPTRKCKSCGKSYPPSVKICVDCGLDMKTGRPLLATDDSTVDQAYATAESVLTWLSWLIPWGIYPIASEAFGTRKPWVTRVIGGVTVLVSVWYMIAYIYTTESSPGLANLMLWGGDPADTEYLEFFGLYPGEVGFHGYQLFTHMFLHGGPLHLAGNLLFLFVFGSRVNALIGNILTAAVYPLLGVGAGVAHLMAAANEPLSPMLGASGAIMGLAGMYLVYFPVHKVHMAAWWRWGLIGGFRLKLNIFEVLGVFVVLFYIAFDVFFTALRLDTGTAHWAHLGGFIAGIACAVLLMCARLVHARGGDLLSRLFGRLAWLLIGKPNRPARSLW